MELGLENMDSVYMDDEEFDLDVNGVSIVPSVTVDHHSDGFMHPVKNQGSCGSCWAFAATTALEGTINKKLNQPNSGLHLSEQQGVDCTTDTDANKEMFGKTYKNSGCQGGWMHRHWYFMYEQGVMLDKDYPYKGKQ